MNITNNQNLIAIVHRGFISNPETPESIKQNMKVGDLRSLVNCNDEGMNVYASLLLGQCSEANLNPNNNSKRYQFTALTNREKLLKLVFEASFHQMPDALITAAQRCDKKSSRFYSYSKNICQIKIPYAIGAITGNTLIKVVVVIATLYPSYLLMHSAYTGTTLLVKRIIPIIVKHTPTFILHRKKDLVHVVNTVTKNWFIVIGCAWIAREIIIRLPNIPYVTTFASKIDLWLIFNILCNSPQTVGEFAIETALNGADFICSQCDLVSAFFNEISRKAESEQLSITKVKTYAVWQKLIAKAAPELNLNLESNAA